MALRINVPGVSTRPGIVTATRDVLLVGNNGGVRYASDYAYGYSYAPGPASNGKVIKDIAERADGSYVLGSGQAVAQAGGGLDYSAVTAPGSYEILPASVLADIWTAIGGVSQQFLVCGYVKLPAFADYQADSVSCPILAGANGSSGFLGGPDLLTIAQRSKNLLFYRQTTGSVQDLITLTPDTSHYGSICQVAFWRTASAQGARIKTVSASPVAVIGSAAVGAANTQDFSAVQLKWGMPNALWPAGLGGGSATAKKFRTDRLWIENLARSGRTPVTVLDADLARVLDRGAFS